MRLPNHDHHAGMDRVDLIFFDEPQFVRALGDVSRRRHRPRHAPMKINMMLHFYACAEAFAPEAQRRSSAYTMFVKELLREGLIERPTHRQREEYRGWAYKATEKGKAWVHALCTVPVPVAKTRWIIPS
jgi:hypothetical protein